MTLKRTKRTKRVPNLGRAPTLGQIPNLGHPPPAPIEPENLAATPPPETGRAHCPSCGRFVGPYERCPFCGARQSHRLPLNAVKWGAALVAAVGVLLLGWAARRVESPLISAAQAGGTTNFATVRIHGRVAPGLSYDPESDYLGFWVEDESGEVRVNAYRDTTRDLIDAGALPAPGDVVTVTGTLRVREDMTSMTLNAAEHLVRVRPEAEQVEADEITPLDEGRRVKLSGEVSELAHPYEGLTLIKIAGEGRSLEIAIEENLEALTGALPALAEGQLITVDGVVTLYRGEPQLVPASVDDLTILSEPPPTPTPLAPEPLAKLVALEPGTAVCARGQIVRMVGLKGGMKATLDDGTAQLPVVLWSRVYDALDDPGAVDVGATVEIRGEMAAYEGAPELMPDSTAQVRVVEPAPPPPWVGITDLSEADVGRIVRIRGVVDTVWGFSSGVKLLLNDGTGALDVVLWADLYDRLARPPETGLPVEVTGVVDVFRGELELIPRSIHDWRTAD